MSRGSVLDPEPILLGLSHNIGCLLDNRIMVFAKYCSASIKIFGNILFVVNYTPGTV